MAQNEINLSSIAGGRVNEMFRQSFEKVMQNLQDVNFNPKSKREIQIKFVFEASEDRKQFDLHYSVKEKLADRAPAKTLVYMGRDLNTGQIMYEEAGSGLRGQIALSDYDVKQAVDDEGKVKNFLNYKEA